MQNYIEKIKDAFLELANEKIDIEINKKKDCVTYEFLEYRINFYPKHNGFDAHKRFVIEDLYDILDYTATFNSALGVVLANYLVRKVNIYIESLDNLENNHIME